MTRQRTTRQRTPHIPTAGKRELELAKFIKCKNCKEDNPASSKFCGDCGQKLVADEPEDDVTELKKRVAQLEKKLKVDGF